MYVSALKNECRVGFTEREWLYCYIRPGAENDCSTEEQAQTEEYFKAMTEVDIKKLTSNIIAGLPGAEEGYTLKEFQAQLDRYQGITKDGLRQNMAHFLKELMPVCEQGGLRMAVHPDDPPRPILGLPCIVSTIEDVEWLTTEVPSQCNGISMCTGSYGVRADNDLVKMTETFADRVYFTHLRSTHREEKPMSFHEVAHTPGGTNLA